LTNYDIIYLGKKAEELGFVRDTLEKVTRLADILEYLNTNPILKDSLVTQVVNYDVTEEVVYFSTENGVFSIKEGERPVFLYPLTGIDDLYVYNNNLYMYNQGELTVQRTDGRYEVYEML